MTVQLFATSSATILVFLICTTLLDKTNQANILYPVQALITLTGLLGCIGRAHIFKNSRSRWMLTVSMFSLLFADIFYFLLNYFRKYQFENHELSSFIFTILPYTVNGLTAFLFLISTHEASFSGEVKKENTPKLLFQYLPTLMLVPASLKYLFLPLIEQFRQNRLSITVVSHLLLIVTSLLTFHTASQVILKSKNLAVSLIATGFLFLALTNWGVEVELMTNKELKFSMYDHVWFFGIFLIVVPILIKRKNGLTLYENVVNENSLVQSFRFWLLLLLLFPLVCLSLFQKTNPEGIAILTLGIQGGILVIILASEILILKINHFSSMIEKTLSYSIKRRASADGEDSLPVELRNTFLLVFRKRLQEEHIKAEQKAKTAQILADLAARVAHDVRSPLAALNMTLTDLPSLSAQERNIIHGVISRISEIANDLLSQTRAQSRRLEKSQHQKDTTSIVPLIKLTKEIVREKKIEFRSKCGVKIISNFDHYDFELFSEVQDGELKRILSNLINNAVEALGGQGIVSIGLSSNSKFNLISISDNGKGIPPGLFPKLGLKGETYGKPEGSGLGIFHALSQIKTWNGNLRFSSQEGKGTSVIIELQKASALQRSADATGT